MATGRVVSKFYTILHRAHEANMKSRILLVEDEAGVALVVSNLLRAEGHSVETASDGKSAGGQNIHPNEILVKIEPEVSWELGQ